MKTNNSKLRNVLLALATAACTLTGAMANEDSILNSDPIDINGYIKEAPATDHELETVKNELRKQKQAIQVNKQKGKKYKELSRTTEKLADVTEEMIDERKESQYTIDRFNKKIDCLMKESEADPDCDEFVRGRRSDKVSTGQAAPQKVEASVSTPGRMGDVIKVLPYSGMTAISSENESLEANIDAGIRVESDITERFSVGLGFGYRSLKTTDFANAYKGYYQSGYNYDDYSSAYAGGREVEYSNLGFELYSKFFVTKTNRFRPYMGAGLSYNRSSMNYMDNTNHSYTYQNGQQQNVARFGDEEVISSHIKAQLVGGSEVVFTKNIGMNLELQYSRGLGGNLSSESATSGPDQQRLEELNNELISANMFSVFAGMLIQF
ncbi:MAG: hypothetical protein KC478_03705 [Bacteriovoracaceae bacterium]|nr:hypothetical protein [Bacteriovoracaceae bacterium]